MGIKVPWDTFSDLHLENDENSNCIRRHKIFYNHLTALQTISSWYTEVARGQSFSNHVQQIERLLHTKHVMDHMA